MFLDVKGRLPSDLTGDVIRETLTKELKSAGCTVKITQKDELEWRGPWWPTQWVVFPFLERARDPWLMRGKFSFKENAYEGVDVLYHVRLILWRFIFIATTAFILTIYLIRGDQSYRMPLFVPIMWLIGYGSVYLYARLWVKHFINEQINIIKKESEGT